MPTAGPSSGRQSHSVDMNNNINNPLMPSCNDMSHLLFQSTILNFAHRVYLWISYYSPAKRNVFIYLYRIKRVIFVMILCCLLWQKDWTFKYQDELCFKGQRIYDLWNYDLHVTMKNCWFKWGRNSELYFFTFTETSNGYVLK